jgi:hypothetical protein
MNQVPVVSLDGEQCSSIGPRVRSTTFARRARTLPVVLALPAKDRYCGRQLWG